MPKSPGCIPPCPFSIRHSHALDVIGRDLKPLSSLPFFSPLSAQGAAFTAHWRHLFQKASSLASTFDSTFSQHRALQSRWREARAAARPTGELSRFLSVTSPPASFPNKAHEPFQHDMTRELTLPQCQGRRRAHSVCRASSPCPRPRIFLTPDRFRCKVGGEWKPLSAFSNKQQRLVQGQMGRDAPINAAHTGMTCRDHSGAPRTELKCEVCNESKLLSEFSKNSRRNGEQVNRQLLVTSMTSTHLSADVQALLCLERDSGARSHPSSPPNGPHFRRGERQRSLGYRLHGKQRLLFR